MSGHSKWLAPSSMGRRIICQGSAYLEAEMPDQGSPAADQGTACHLLVEQVVSSGSDQSDAVGKEIIPGVICTDEMVEMVNRAGYAALHLLDTAGTVSTEMRLEGIPGVFGTADMVIDEMFGTLTVVDYKFGQVEVKPDCAQLKTYAILAAGEHLPTYADIKLVIIQPSTPGVISEHVMQPSELAAWRDEVLLPTVEAINSGTAGRKADPEACKYCKATSICPEYNQAALAVAQADFRGVITAPVITEALVNTLYPQLALLDQWIGTIKAKAREMAEEGRLEGHKLVAGRSSRAWADEAAAIEMLTANGNDPYERKILSPAKAEKLGADVKAAVKDLIVKTWGEPTIAPLSSSKPAIPPRTTAREDFATETPCQLNN